VKPSQIANPKKNYKDTNRAN